MNKIEIFTREQFDKGELETEYNRQDNIYYEKFQTKIKTERIECKECRRTFLENRSVNKFTHEGIEVEIEPWNLCRICFKKIKHRMSKAYNLQRLKEKEIINDEFLVNYVKKEKKDGKLIISEQMVSKLLSDLERELI